MAINLFTKLIKCTNCNSNYRIIKERGKNKYVCNQYSKNGETRFIIKEEDLLSIIKIFCSRNEIELQQTNKFMKSIIEKIYADSETKSFVIKYKNGEEAHYTNEKLFL